jgi:hypothetical protein
MTPAFSKFVFVMLPIGRYILALGYRPSIAAAELGCRLLWPGRLWDFGFLAASPGKRMMLEAFGDSYPA